MTTHQYLEFGVRWTMEDGKPQVVAAGSHALAVADLDDPPTGSLDGTIIQRVVTVSPWETAPGGPARTAPLFALPHRVVALPGFPRELVRDTDDFNGLRYLAMGEDDETVVVLGHPPREDVTNFQQWYQKDQGCDPDHNSYSDKVELTYARQLRTCPTHQQKLPDCAWCIRIDPDEPWLDWTRAETEPLQANAAKPHYFPVRLWHLHG